MSIDEPTDAKRPRLETDSIVLQQNAETDDILVPETENEGIINAVNDNTGVSDDILYAARLANIIQHRPKTNFNLPSSVLAWSVTNLLAIARSTSITLTHLLGSSRACHLTITEKPNILSFSPNGDALLATFPGSSSIYLWACNSNTLNQWVLRGSWTQIGGKVLDVRWLGSGRQRSPSSLSRTIARGPQFTSNENSPVSALVISDTGQLRLISGYLNSTSDLRCYQHQISLNSNQRLQQVKIGLIPDEPLAILAYTLRFSSKANLPHTSGAGDALDMFFDGAEGTSSTSGAPMPIDGQDVIRLMEVRIDLYPSDLSLAMYSRPLVPIYTSTFDQKTMPNTEYLNQLEWIDVEPSGKDEGTELQLFSSFFQEGNSTLRLWKMKREDGTRLSGAFGKLEAAKTNQASSEDDEWVSQESLNLIVENEQLSNFVSSPWMERRLLCTSQTSQIIDRLEDVTQTKRVYKVIDTKAMEIRSMETDIGLLTKCNDHLCRIAISPHATMIAGIGKGKVVLAPISGLHEEKVDDISLYSAAVVDGQDLSDLIRSRKIPVMTQVASRLKFGDRLKLQNALQLTSLQIRCAKKEDFSIQNGLMILKLATVLRQLIAAQNSGEGSFELSRMWSLIAQFEWTLSVLEMTARQAYLLHVKADETTPSSTVETGNEEQSSAIELLKNEPNMLSLLTSYIPRQLVVKIILRLVTFYNWLEDTMAGQDDNAKQAFIASVHKSALASSDTAASGGATKAIEVLQLAHTRALELVEGSSIDLSQTGRFLNSFKGLDDAKEDLEWYLTPQVSTERQQAFAQAYLSSNSIRNTLNLFCPPSEWMTTSLGQDEENDIDWLEGETNESSWPQSSQENRDILTSTILSKGPSLRRTCLSCKGQTQRDVSNGVRCMCGSATWWATWWAEGDS